MVGMEDLPSFAAMLSGSFHPLVGVGARGRGGWDASAPAVQTWCPAPPPVGWALWEQSVVAADAAHSLLRPCAGR